MWECENQVWPGKQTERRVTETCMSMTSLEVLQAWESNPLLPVARKLTNLHAHRHLHMDGNEGGKKWGKKKEKEPAEEKKEHGMLMEQVCWPFSNPRPWDEQLCSLAWVLVLASNYSLYTMAPKPSFSKSYLQTSSFSATWENFQKFKLGSLVSPTESET